MLKRVCVFCGSNPGNDPVFLAAARDLGQALASAGLELVYGGASVGLMGAVADGALAHGGKVIGILPEALAAKELAHKSLTELRIVGSMHARKAMMADHADGFIALPGGVGTFEEFFEVWTWGQLGYHGKPCALLNIAGFYDGLLAFLDDVAGRGFMKQAHRDMLVVDSTIAPLLEAMQAYRAPDVAKWIGAEQR